MLTYTGSDGKKESCLSEDIDMKCALAASALLGIMENIMESTIKLQEMIMIIGRRKQFEMLYSADKQYDCGDIKNFLVQRAEECTAFKQHNTSLEIFYREMDASKLQIKG